MAIPAAVVGAISSGEATIAAITSAVNKGTRESENIIKKSIEGIKSAITDLADHFDKLKNVILDTTKAFAPYTVLLFNRALLDLKATFGQIFLPIVKQGIVIVRALADAIYNLPTGFKTAIRAVAEIVLSISGITAVSVGVVGAIAAVVLGIGGLVAGLLVLGGVIIAFLPLLVSIGVLLAPFVAIVGVISTVLVAVTAGLAILARMFFQTEGGARLLANLMRGFDQIVNTVSAAFKGIMSVLGPVFDALSNALSELGDALSELFDALKPILAAGLIAAIGALATILTVLAKVVTAVVNVITFMVRMLRNTLPGQILGLLGDLMPETQNKKSSFGLGWSTASVETDPNALYNKITEELLRNTRMGAGEEKDPAKEAAKNTGETVRLLTLIHDFLVELGKNPARNFAAGIPGALILRR